MIASLTLATLALGATITVDDNGPADHPSIGAAVYAAQAGDVILVEPGNYGPFLLDAALTIVGRAGSAVKPCPMGESTLITSPGARAASCASPCPMGL